jgi:hypothetical protein
VNPPGAFQELVPAGAGAVAAPAPRELPPLRARDIGELLDVAVDVLRQHLTGCVLLAASLWVPVLVLDRLGSDLQPTARDIYGLAVLLLGLPVSFVSVAFVTLIVYGYLQGRPVGIGQASLLAAKRAPALLVSTLTSTLLIGLGTAFCFAPGVWAAWLFSVSSAALVLEQLGPLAALRRSARLVRGSFRRWAGLMLLSVALMAPINLLSALLTLPELQSLREQVTWLEGTPFDVAYVVLSALLSGFGTAFFGIVVTVLYLDLRVRAEGLDLAMGLERARDRHAARTAAARGAQA